MDRRVVPGRALLKALGGWLLGGGALYGVLLLIGRVLATSFYRAHRGDFGAAFLLAAYAVLFAALTWAVGLRGLRETLGFRFTSAVHLVAAPAVWLVTVLVGAALSVPLERWFGKPESNATALLRVAHDPVATALLIATVVLVGPICEELLFRGALFGWLRGRAGVAGAAPASAALFAGAHLFPQGFVLLFVFGVSAALFYARTGSTLNTFVMHACQNTAAVLAIYWGIGGR